MLGQIWLQLNITGFYDFLYKKNLPCIEYNRWKKINEEEIFTKHQDPRALSSTYKQNHNASTWALSNYKIQ